MANTNLRPAFYALPPGAWRDYVTLLHIPYTVWHLSYVVIGASIAPSLHLDRLAGTLLAFFLAVGLAAHALDEFHGRPLGSHIPDGWLLAIAVLSLAAALVVGALAVVQISFWALPLVIFGGFMVPAYNLEWLKGRWHSDIWFGISWGAFPALVGYWANSERLDIQVLLVASACFVLSLAQRTLSRQARLLRRSTATVSGHVEFIDGRTEVISVSFLLRAPELALRLMGLSITLLALGLLAVRL
jgi:heme O synthase-like polyprenyltransferase